MGNSGGAFPPANVKLLYVDPNKVWADAIARQKRPLMEDSVYPGRWRSGVPGLAGNPAPQAFLPGAPIIRSPTGATQASDGKGQPFGVPYVDLSKIEAGRLGKYCKSTKGLGFCKERYYFAWLGDGGEASGADGKAKAIHSAGEGGGWYKPILRGEWCKNAYRKILCAFFLPFCWNGQRKLMPCASLCKDFCRACGVCGTQSLLRMNQNYKGMYLPVIQYCSPLMRFKMPPRECTEARSCGWLDWPPRMSVQACPIIND